MGCLFPSPLARESKTGLRHFGLVPASSSPSLKFMKQRKTQHSASVAALTSHHRLGGSKLPKCILTQLWSHDEWGCPFQRLPGDSVPCLFQPLLAAGTWVPCPDLCPQPSCSSSSSRLCQLLPPCCPGSLRGQGQGFQSYLRCPPFVGAIYKSMMGFKPRQSYKVG